MIAPLQAATIIAENKSLREIQMLPKSVEAVDILVTDQFHSHFEPILQTQAAFPGRNVRFIACRFRVILPRVTKLLTITCSDASNR